MQYYKSDFEEVSYWKRHPFVTKAIWWGVGFVIAAICSYMGGIEYLIRDWMK
jgi:hypothetical protein